LTRSPTDWSTGGCDAMRCAVPSRSIGPIQPRRCGRKRLEKGALMFCLHVDVCGTATHRQIDPCSDDQ
jgi:hypothetical protein